MAVQRPCGLCPLPCRGDRAPFRLYPAGNKEGKYSHDSCIKAEKKRTRVEVALAQSDTSGAAVMPVVKKQKTGDADTDPKVSCAATAGEHFGGEAGSSLLSEDAAAPAASSPSSNAVDAAQLLYALHTRYI